MMIGSLRSFSLRAFKVASQFRSMSRVALLQRSPIVPFRSFSNAMMEDVQDVEFKEKEFDSDDAAKNAENMESKIIEESEQVVGQFSKHGFKAETKRLLDIVANSLYSEKEVFVRELISNASDALEKLRHHQLKESEQNINNPLEIHLSVDPVKKQFIIQDYGIGMNLEELNEHLGTIAKSGSLKFLEKNSESASRDRIIGQFGVGFYSALMVGKEIRVYTKSVTDPTGHIWKTDGSGNYEVAEADGVHVGTKIVIDLKDECLEFCKKDAVEKIIKKYSQFVNFPVILNGTRINTLEPLWTKEKSEINDKERKEFYQFVSKKYDEPAYWLQYKIDSPLNISSILFISPPDMFSFEMKGSKINLYSRKVLIKSGCEEILPSWLRFISGVIDSEDIPLNLSRELLQKDGTILKLKSILTKRIVKWINEEAEKDPQKFAEFYRCYNFYFKQGMWTEPADVNFIKDLLRFESSKIENSKLTSLKEYVERMPQDQKAIYYAIASNRDLALESPYIEPFTKKGYEVLLFSNDEIDVAMGPMLQNYKNFPLKDIEKESVEIQDESSPSLSESEINEVVAYLKDSLKDKVESVTATKRFTTHPALILDHSDMKASKMMMKRAGISFTNLKYSLEINPKHPLIESLLKLQSSRPEIATVVARQIYDNAMIAAGLLDDPKKMLNHLNNLTSILCTEVLKSQ